jgi:hypothetical protein
MEVAEARFRHEHVDWLEFQQVPGRVEGVDGNRLEPGAPKAAANRGPRAAVRMNDQSHWRQSVALHNISKPLQRFSTSAAVKPSSCAMASSLPLNGGPKNPRTRRRLVQMKKSDP